MLDVIMGHNKHDVCAFLPSFVAPLRHTAKIFSKRSLPHIRRSRVN
jgi:hypothetical protein